MLRNTDKICYTAIILILYKGGREMRDAVLLLLAMVNLIAFVLCGIDKYKAIRRKRRIRERTLLTLGVCFGAAGLFAGMVLFHHKTVDRAFMPWVPLMLPVQVAILVWAGRKLFG